MTNLKLRTMLRLPLTSCEYDRPCEVIRCESWCFLSLTHFHSKLVTNQSLALPCFSASKDENTTLHLLHDAEHQGELFVQVYQHPKYVASMSGIPYGLMRMANINDGAFADDDFFEIHQAYPAFQKLLKNYTFTLRYTGRRWYGQMEPPGISSKSFAEEEYHGEYLNFIDNTGISSL